MSLRQYRRKLEYTFARFVARLPVSSRLFGPPWSAVAAEDAIDSTVQVLHPGWSRELPPFPLATDGRTQPERVEEPPTFVSTHPRARVFGPSGVVITADDRVIRESAFEWGNHHSVFGKLRLGRLQRVAGTLAVVAGAAPDSFYHWMVEILPRLELLRLAGVAYDRIYFGPAPSLFHTRTLDLIGVPPESRITEGWRHTHLAADRVVFASRTTARTGTVIPEWVVKWLRDQFLPDATADTDVPPAELLYVPRRRRGVLNHDELWDMLDRRGFRAVHLEDLSIPSQAAVFAGARVIVAPHGAGLTHLVFCRPGTVVVELFPADYINGCFFFMACQLGLRYAPVCGTAGLTRDDECFTVEVSDVERALAEGESTAAYAIR